MDTSLDLDLRIAHTADLRRDELDALRALMDQVFPDDFDDDDWDHSLGGLHVIASADGSAVGHAAVVLRRVITGGRTLRAGYVEAVGVHPDHQRRGIGTAMMTEVGRIVHGGHDLGLLGSSEEGWRLYEQAGWVPWRGPLSALTPSGVVACPEESGWVLALPTATPLDLDRELTCDWREGDVW